MKTCSSLLASLLLVSWVGSSAASPASSQQRPITVHRAYILPEELVRAQVRASQTARVYLLAFYEPGCAGDEAWASKTVGCYSVRREYDAPSAAWKEAMVRLLADPKTYSTQFERECAGSPEYAIRLEGGGKDPVDAWVCLACSQITVTVGSKMKARGGFDRASGELRKLMTEVVGARGAAEPSSRVLSKDEFPLERNALPVDEDPMLEGKNPGVRIVGGNLCLGPRQRGLRLRVDPEGSHVLVWLEEGASRADRSEVESLVKRLVFSPARRNGLPVSAWIDIVYSPPP